MFLRHKHVFWVGFLLASSLASGCPGDLGTPDYSDQVGLRDPVDPFPPVPPDPFEPGDERLSVGYFYEGGWSVEIPINGINTNYFVFAVDADNIVATLTYSQDVTSDRLEGLESVEISLNDQPFWGGGIIWDDPTDLSEWTWMFVGFKSSDPSFESFDLSLQSGEGEDPTGINPPLDPRDYGYVNDGEWHFLEIPLQDAIDLGWDPSTARSPFIFSAPGGDAGDVLLIDNLYFTKD